MQGLGARKVTRSRGEALRLRGGSRSPGYHQRRPCPQPVRRPLGGGEGVRPLRGYRELKVENGAEKGVRA